MSRKSIVLIFFCLVLCIQGQPQDINTTEICKDVIVVHGGGGNVTAIRTDAGIVVADSFTTPKEAREARKLIEKHFSGVSIKYLINTHHHSDHIWGNQVFGDAVIIGHANIMNHLIEDYDETLKKYGDYDAKIRMLERQLNEKKNSKSVELKKLKDDLALWKWLKELLEELVPTPPSLQITSDAYLKLGGKTFEILYFGTAHTDNDLVILDRKDKLLIMGDLLFYRKCHIMGPKADAKNWISIMNKLIARSDQYEYVIPGHGAIHTDVSALEEQRDFLNDIWNAVNDARQRGLTLEQAKKEIHLEKYKNWLDYDRIGLDIEACWAQIKKNSL
jgi:cyclase